MLNFFKKAAPLAVTAAEETGSNKTATIVKIAVGVVVVGLVGAGVSVAAANALAEADI